MGSQSGGSIANCYAAGVKTADELMTQATQEGNGWAFSSFAWRWNIEKFPCLNLGTEKFPFLIFFTDDDDKESGGGGGGDAGYGLFAFDSRSAD